MGVFVTIVGARQFFVLQVIEFHPLVVVGPRRAAARRQREAADAGRQPRVAAPGQGRAHRGTQQVTNVFLLFLETILETYSC